MKKFTLVFGTILLSGVATFAQVRVGVTAGAQLANIRTRTATGSENGDNKAGPFGGLVLNAPLSNNLSIRPQLLYSMKGVKDRFGGAKTLVTLSYVEIPVQLTYGLEAGKGKIVLGAGPYVGYALNGTVTIKFAGQTEREAVVFGEADDQLKRLDVGLRLSAGYEWGPGLSVSAFLSPGLANIANDSEVTVTNRIFGLSLGYPFGGR